MRLDRHDIENLSRIERLNLINSITGIKPANLVGTISRDNITNLAVFSSVVHLGSHPPLLALVVRPAGDVPRHTYENIKATGVYTINHVHRRFTAPAHFTSAKFPEGVSEFDTCGLTEEFIDGFAAPFVKESVVKIGLSYEEEIHIRRNNTIMLIGEIRHIILPDHASDQNGHLNLEQLQSVGISGLNSYYALRKLAQYPMHNRIMLPITCMKNKNVKKGDFPSRVCIVCGRPFQWRKKWEKVWEEVKYCSDRCRMNRNKK